MDDKDDRKPASPLGDIVSLEDRRRQAAPSPSPTDDPAPPAADGDAPPPAVSVDANEFLKPVMAAIARELAAVAEPDGTVRVGGDDEASRAKTAAVVKGLGAGLGQALAEAFGKWAQKIEDGQPVGGNKVDVRVTTQPLPSDEPPKRD